MKDNNESEKYVFYVFNWKQPIWMGSVQIFTNG